MKSPLSLLFLGLLGGLVALVACGSNGEASAANTNDGAVATGTNDAAAGDGGHTLATGALVAPFTCGLDAIQGEPRPGSALLEQLRVAASLDVLEERSAVGADVDAGVSSNLRAGTPCSGATDKPTCQTTFAQLASGGEALRPAFDESDYAGAVQAGSSAGPPGYYLAYTKGDVVGKVSNHTELRAVFPAIDTPAKALLYANAAGYRVECQRADGWVREETDGFVLAASRGHEKRCSRTDVVLFVRRDGTTEERDAIENQPDPCT